MENLTDKDLELIDIASETIKRNYDKENYRHTVAAVIRCKDGKIYKGINISSIHGACSEMIAVGAAMTDGEREFESLVSVRGENGEEILPPCGNCRQFLSDYMPDCKVIIKTNNGLKKIAVRDLLPFAYTVPMEDK